MIIENIQPEIAGFLLNQENIRIILFVGTNQTKLASDLVMALHSMGERVQYIRVTGNGPNALDFHIAFYIGERAAQEPTAHFHIISKDTGFDPLIQHLKSRRIRVHRREQVSDIPIVQRNNAGNTADSPIAQRNNTRLLSEKVTLIINDLQRRGKAKPRTVTALSNTINALFQKELLAEELPLFLQELQKQGFITLQGTKVSYGDTVKQ